MIVRARTLVLAITFVLDADVFHARALHAEPQSQQYIDVRKQLQVWKDQPSMDTTPIALSIENVHYKVPRNYISWMDPWVGGPQTLVTFKVAFPGFEPLTEKTKACMSLAPAYRPIGCAPIEFIVRAGQGGLSDEEQFNNRRDLFHSQAPLQGPFGFELYETGTEDARINTYRMQTPEHTLVIDCFLHKTDAGVEHDPVCTNHSRLANGNVLAYHLYGHQLKDAVQIDGGLRALIKAFTWSEPDSSKAHVH